MTSTYVKLIAVINGLGTFSVVIICFTFLLGSVSIALAEKLAPGKQVAHSIDLPAVVRPNEGERRRNSMRARLVLPVLSETEKTSMSYWLFLPNDYGKDSEKKYPLLLFLHGAGERGNDIAKVKAHGLPKLLQNEKISADWPFITVSPQCPPGVSWAPSQLMLMIEELESKYDIDPERIYVTGLSMGGFGTWGLLYHYPEKFAAGAPICGGFPPEGAEELLDVPIWAFHGLKDDVVKPDMSIGIINAIKEKGGQKYRMTFYPELDHDSWTLTYENPELYRWFLRQK